MRNIARVAGLVALATGACNGPGDLVGDPQRVTDKYYQSYAQPVDVLWVVDYSGTMDEERRAIDQNFVRFIERFAALGLDFHLALTTTDMSPEGHRGAFVGPVLTSQQPIDTVITEFKRQINAAETDRNWAEMGLRPAKEALSPAALRSVNAGFLRDEALLAVIIVSDEDDQSGTYNVDREQPSAGNEDPANMDDVSTYIDFFKSLKRDPSLFQLSLIVGEPTGPAWILQDCPGNPSNSRRPGYRYHEAVSLVQGGVTADICDTDVGAVLQYLAEQITGRVSEFQLSGKPHDGSVTVTIDGRAIPAGDYTYDADKNVIVFDDAAMTTECSEVEIQYLVGPSDSTTGVQGEPDAQCRAELEGTKTGAGCRQSGSRSGIGPALLVLAALALVLFRKGGDEHPFRRKND